MNSNAIQAPHKEGTSLTLSREILKSGLSYRSIGFMAYVLGSEEGFSIQDLRRTDLGPAAYLGRDAVYAILTELIEFGFLSRDRVRGASGKYTEIVYSISESAFERVKNK